MVDVAKASGRTMGEPVSNLGTHVSLAGAPQRYFILTPRGGRWDTRIAP